MFVKICIFSRVVLGRSKVHNFWWATSFHTVCVSNIWNLQSRYRSAMLIPYSLVLNPANPDVGTDRSTHLQGGLQGSNIRDTCRGHAPSCSLPRGGYLQIAAGGALIAIATVSRAVTWQGPYCHLPLLYGSWLCSAITVLPSENGKLKWLHDVSEAMNDADLCRSQEAEISMLWVVLRLLMNIWLLQWFVTLTPGYLFNVVYDINFFLTLRSRGDILQ